MEFDEYRAHDATALAKLVADKQVSAAELLATARERAAKVNPQINAIVRDVPASPSDDLTGPFAGVPFLIKDLAQDYAGLPTSAGSRALMSLIIPEHATVVQRWLDAGLVIFGKTNTPEFGAKGITEPDAWGPARNPGIWRGRRVGAREDPRPPWPRASCPARVPMTAADRFASRRPAVDWSGSSRAAV